MNKKINIDNLKSEIEHKGYTVLRSFVNNKELKVLKNLVDKKIVENNNQYFFLSTKNSKNTILNNKDFLKKNELLLKKLVNAYKFSNRKNEKLYKVLRVVTGKKSEEVSLDYHFDSHLLTLLIPIYIPKRKGSNNGHLIIFKNFRSLTFNFIKNIIQKLIFQSSFFKYILNKGIIKGQILKLKPGNAYIFNGFRTLHTNLDINEKDIRATMLVHYYDIFQESYLLKKNRELRNIKEFKNINNNKIKFN